jgi:hypothetical protein
MGIVVRRCGAGRVLMTRSDWSGLAVMRIEAHEDEAGGTSTALNRTPHEEYDTRDRRCRRAGCQTSANYQQDGRERVIPRS